MVLYIRSRIGADTSELAQCNDVDELFRRLHTMQVISKADQDLMDSILKKEQEINDLKSLKEQEEQNAKEQLEQSLKDLQELEVSRSQAEERIQASEETLAKIARQEDQLEKEDKELGSLSKAELQRQVYRRSHDMASSRVYAHILILWQQTPPHTEGIQIPQRIDIGAPRVHIYTPQPAER